jgi:hypothetical protein
MGSRHRDIIDPDIRLMASAQGDFLVLEGNDMYGLEVIIILQLIERFEYNIVLVYGSEDLNEVINFITVSIHDESD